MFKPDTNMTRTDRIALCMSMLIQIGKTLDDLEEKEAAIMCAEATSLLASKQFPENEKDRQTLEDIQSGLKTVVDLLKKETKKRIIQ